MPDNLSDELKLSSAFKSGAERVIDTDPDKSFIEESLFHYTIITKDDIYAQTIPFNNPSGGIALGIVQSGLLILPLDVTVGGGFRGFDALGLQDIIMPQRFGTKYAPVFYHSSGAVQIQDGDFYENAIFDFKQGYVTVQRNAITDAWISPLAVDGYFYSGRYFSGGVEFSQLLQMSGDIINQIVFNSGGVTQQQLIQTSGDLNAKIPNIKRGYISGNTFSGLPLQYEVIFDFPFSSQKLSIQLSSTIGRVFHVLPNYTSGSFKITSTSNRIMGPTDTVFWQAIEV